MPRQLQPNTSPSEDMYNASRKRGARNKPNLPSINERQAVSGRTPKSPLSQRHDAAGRSSSDLQSLDAYDSREAVGGGVAAIVDARDADSLRSDMDDPYGVDAPRKVQKGQINALAKMLSALRR